MQKQIQIELNGDIDVYKTVLDDSLNNPSKLHDLENDFYRSCPGVSQSDLKEFIKSPSHYRYKKIYRNSSESSKAMDFGSLIHAAILEPERLEEFYNDSEIIDKVLKLRPDLKNVRASKEYKKMVLDIKNQGKKIISNDDHLKAMNIVSKVYSHPTCQKLLTGGFAEKSIFAIDDKTGLLLKARLDYFLDDGIIIDPKTTNNASKKEFSRKIYNLGYHIQAAFYLKIMTISQGIPFDTFVNIAIENYGDNEIALYSIDRETLELGLEIVEYNLEKLATCYEKNNWESYSEQVQEISVPDYAWKYSNI